MNVTMRHGPPSLRDAQAVGELFLGFFRRDLLIYYPQSRFEPVRPGTVRFDPGIGPDFRLYEGERQGNEALEIFLFGTRYLLTPRPGRCFTTHDRRMIRAIGAVLNLRYHHLFHVSHGSRLDLYRGGSEDHYVAAFLEPSAYDPAATRPSRIASTILTLRTAALSTYENRRVTTGALLLGLENDDDIIPLTSPDALDYGVELTSLKTIHRLCDGRRTLFLVDRAGRLANIIDVQQWGTERSGPGELEVPCARSYAAHAAATRHGGHVCLVLSPNQEIKLFSGGMQTFAFAHGRWRILDPAAKYEIWENATAHPKLARVLFQTALDLAECRNGGLLVVLDDPNKAVGRLIAPHDLLAPEEPAGPPPELTPGDPLAKRALHYLARGRDVTALASSVLESLAGLDGALATDRTGRLVAFGAILRHDASDVGTTTNAEGARTIAGLAASRFGPVLKVSEDGIISCFLDGTRVWDL